MPSLPPNTQPGSPVKKAKLIHHSLIGIGFYSSENDRRNTVYFAIRRAAQILGVTLEITHDLDQQRIEIDSLKKKSEYAYACLKGCVSTTNTSSDPCSMWGKWGQFGWGAVGMVGGVVTSTWALLAVYAPKDPAALVFYTLATCFIAGAGGGFGVGVGLYTLTSLSCYSASEAKTYSDAASNLDHLIKKFDAICNQKIEIVVEKSSSENYSLKPGSSYV